MTVKELVNTLSNVPEDTDVQLLIHPWEHQYDRTYSKEETMAILHEMFESLDPLIELVENMKCQDITIGEVLGLTGVIVALKNLNNELRALDRAVQY